MVCQTASGAISNARQRVRDNSTNGAGMCLKDTRGHLEIGSLFMTAQDAWDDLGPADKTPYDGNPNRIPAGAPCWSKGSNPAGHIFLAGRVSDKTGRRLFFTNDQFGDGRIT